MIGDYSFELLFTDGRMRIKKKEHLRKWLQHYIGNVLWPSEVSQQTTTRQRKAYIYKTILCQRRREKFSINVNQINRHGQPITTKNRFWVIAFSSSKCVKSYMFTLSLTQHFPRVQLKRSKTLIHSENTTTFIFAKYTR